jgi:hypothetical protein
MPHLDEGTLHALLDGELELAEVKEIQTHLGACSACGSRLQDVKQFLAESDQLVGALETPAAAPRTRREPAPAPPAASPSSGPKTWNEPVWDSAPEILLPGDAEDGSRRRRWGRRLRWAAMIALVVGAGQLVKRTFTPAEPELQLNGRDVTTAAKASPPAAVSQEDRVRPESALAKDSRPAPVTRTRPPAPAPEPKVLAAQPAPDSAAAESQLDSTIDSTTAAEEDTSPSPAEPVLAAANRADTETTRPRTPAADIATRQAAAAALEELDRERLRSRANAATASLPPARQELPPAVAPPPPPRTLEQKAQVYLRIGLDEAVKQLGRPMHVIEAMTPEFIGLTQGRLVSGADPARPVVRVVYQDSRGRMILLDQQRLATGQAAGAAAGNLRWAQGEVMLYLHGEPGLDVLRNLQRRVR